MILEQALMAYDAWPDRQPLAAKTRAAYRLLMHQYGTYLVLLLPTADDSLHTTFTCDYAVWDYKTYLKAEHQAKPTSVNLALAAIDHSTSLWEMTDHMRWQAPCTLKPEEQKALLLAIERTSSVRNKTKETHTMSLEQKKLRQVIFAC